MSNNSVLLLLGSNLNDKKNNLITAQKHINESLGEILKESEILESEAEDYESSNSFLNQTVRINTKLSPIQLLNKIKIIESNMGRTYKNSEERYQDRIIDIDILTFNDLHYKCEVLSIPHHQLITRKFLKSISNYLLKG